MTTVKERKNYSADFKAKVALEAVRGRLTINQIAKEFSVHPNQISKWKKQFLQSLPQIFDNSKKPNPANNEELINGLYQQIGQMKVELDWLKKKSSLFGWSSSGIGRAGKRADFHQAAMRAIGLKPHPSSITGSDRKAKKMRF